VNNNVIYKEFNMVLNLSVLDFVMKK
jgi:hypothetical protein